MDERVTHLDVTGLELQRVTGVVTYFPVMLASPSPVALDTTSRGCV
jgi:hypothetical protein